MSKKKVIILNGAENGAASLASPFSVLTDILDHDNADVKCYHLEHIKLAHCTGCFGCWIKTPGTCVASDEGSGIIQNIIQSDMTILFTPVTFGGYSSALKMIVDRFIPLILPFFRKYYGELHHSPRYASYPRLVGIGFKRHYAEAEAILFKALVGRNAINFHAPSFAADVFSDEEDIETLKTKMKNVISRTDPFPIQDDIVPFFPKADKASNNTRPREIRNALLVVGSPKTKHLSTSSILGDRNSLKRNDPDRL